MNLFTTLNPEKSTTLIGRGKDFRSIIITLVLITGRPWKRIEMIPALEEACGEKFPPADQLHTAETTEFLKRMLTQMKVECPPPQTNARMLDKMVG